MRLIIKCLAYAWIIIACVVIMVIFSYNQPDKAAHINRRDVAINLLSNGTTTNNVSFPTNKLIVSFSLYGGDNVRYTVGAIENGLLMPKYYPGWAMRVYHDNSVPELLLQTLQAYTFVELVNMEGSYLNPRTWRFLVASDATVERYVVRDIDSRLSHRERVAVDEWITSGRNFHVMRDHPSHSAYAMSSGMWGGTRNAFPDMKTALDSSRIKPYYTADQDFLSSVVWPVARRSVMQHDSFGCHSDRWGETRPFPTPREGAEHVGSVWIDNKMRQGDVDILMTHLHQECKPVNDYITNKKYLSLCDYAFRTRYRSDLKMPVKSDAIICTSGDSAILQAFFALGIDTPYTLITIDSDDSVPHSSFMKSPKVLKRWWGWNAKDHRVNALPIGLNEDTQLQPMRKAIRAKKKIDKLLINFKQDRSERRELYSQFKDFPWVHVEPYTMKWASYQSLTLHYESISKYKWTLCPRGAGQDTHRLWEALYLGSIPVVLKSNLSSLYYGLPVIQLDSWEKLTVGLLQEITDELPNNISNAYFEHWERLIKENTHINYGTY